MAQHADELNTFDGVAVEGPAEAQEAPVLSKRQRILGFADTKRERHRVERWGGEEIEIRGMSGRGRARFIKKISGDDPEAEVDIERFYPALLIETIFDPESGEKLFQEGDEDLINDRAADVLDELGAIASRLSGLTKEAEKELGKP